jgi:hypothetical protein
MEILELIDRLESMVSSGRKVPVFQRAMVDPQKLLEMVDQMRLAVPQSVQDAKEVLERREQIMTQSLKDAQRTKAAAETEARVRVEEGELIKEGKKRVDEIVYEAQIKGQRILEQVQVEVRNRRAGADEYARDVLVKLEQEVSSILASVQHGQLYLGHEMPAPAGSSS